MDRFGHGYSPDTGGRGFPHRPVPESSVIPSPSVVPAAPNGAASRFGLSSTTLRTNRASDTSRRTAPGLGASWSTPVRKLETADSPAPRTTAAGPTTVAASRRPDFGRSATKHDRLPGALRPRRHSSDPRPGRAKAAESPPAARNAMLSPSLRAPFAALLVAGGGAVLLLVGLLGANERSAAVVSALSTAAAIAGAWLLGARPPADDANAETRRPRPRAGRWLTAAFLTSLAAGTLVAASIPASPGAGALASPGLPPSVSGLVVGVFLAPLLLTSLDFAFSFRAPSANDLDRLRRAARETPATRGADE